MVHGMHKRACRRQYPAWHPFLLDPLQAAFNVFGMELLATLDLAATNSFFDTFFRLPRYYWRGFLASTLSAGEVIAFALVVFTIAPWSIKYKLMEHLFTGRRCSTQDALYGCNGAKGLMVWARAPLLDIGRGRMLRHGPVGIWLLKQTNCYDTWFCSLPVHFYHTMYACPCLLQTRPVHTL